MKKIIFVIICIFLLSCTDAHIPIETLGSSEDPITKAGTRCVTGNNAGPVSWDYCMHRYEDSADSVLFYFHGLGGNENSWENGALEQQMLKHWRKRNIRPPIVIAISFGEAWFLAEQNSSPYSGLYNIFMNSIFPEFEKKLSVINLQAAYLMGVSMGGFNAAQIYLRNPKLFDRVALICPAMSTVSPHASAQDIQNYITSTGADPELVTKSLGLAKQFFPTSIDWNKHSPNTVAMNLVGTGFVPVYVSNGTNDPYGFYQGNLAFVNTMKSKGVIANSNFYTGGGHCSVDATRIADALIQF